MNVIVFLIIVSAASAWYVPNDAHDINGVFPTKRRNHGSSQILGSTLWRTERTSMQTIEFGSLEDRVNSWMWGTEGSRVTQTKHGSLEDRAALSVWETERTSVKRSRFGSLEDRVDSWVWGTERPSVTTTELAVLMGRAIFTANGCSSEKFKKGGICAVRD